MQETMLGKDIRKLRYDQYNYSVFYNTNNGSFLRIEDKGYPEPLYSPIGPELLDISITNWCDKGCSFCYRKSDESGKHMKLSDYKRIIDEAKELGVLQVALGGGNPNQHPDFIEIVKYTRERGIVPCYTTNGRGLTKEVLQATKKYCGSVAISVYKPYTEFTNSIQTLLKFGIKTNVHFVLDAKSVDRAINWLENKPKMLDGIGALIFLNYKPIGRNPKFELMLKDQNKISNLFDLVNKKEHDFKIGFDSCSISGVARYIDASTSLYEGCDAGRFSAYIDENLRMLPCSFMTNTDWYGDLNDSSMQEIWQENFFFKKYRNRIINNGCNSCSMQSTCMGGCPFIEELSLCGWKDERLEREKQALLE